ncbi:hypothetical protein PHYPSEUDO_001525 [Phytophthora pseudosyringae]|uniref:Uncharacterized protein n=1 Tax=Phytophthora pseudosyringae TaxID=221518 RepID=A0A8T1VWT8_9STRA|nr:hypothetical protein PHYPSEUDO_001525 [Phytophthora pseudosyringae]
MLQESLGVGGESAASVKRALVQAQKLLQLASVRPNALTLREYREGLEECLKAEGSTAMKLIGFQLAGTAPGCSTHDVWRFILEAVVTELGSSENPSALAAAVPVLGQIPVPLVLGFLLSREREPMNKLHTILTHEDVEVRCDAIETLSKLMLGVAINVAGDGLFVFPFESHEARICCQQDLETMVNDCWKLIFHTLSFDGQSQSAMWAAGTAFTALAGLFARSSSMAPYFSSIRESIRVQAPIDDVASMIYKQAFPRIRALIAVARALPTKQQPDAMLWISMLLYTMMERSGAQCPSVSVPYMEIDCEDTNVDGADDDDEPHASTEPVRIDDLVSDLLESWAFPTISRRVSLAHATSMCRAIFILLAHPLQTFTRMRWAAQLANHVIAQCYLANKTSNNSNAATSPELKHELCVMLVKTFAWLSGVNCQTLFVRTTEALYLVDQEKDRRDLVQTLMDTIAEHVTANRDFQLLQGLCTMAFFRQPKGFSRLSPRTNGSEVFRALFQALANMTELHSPPRRGAVEYQISQLIALRVFRGLLLLKLGGSATTSPKAYRRSCEISENIVYYTGLLTSHFQSMLVCPELALRESIEFFQQELFPSMDQIASQCGRLQILWIGVRLHRNYASHVPFEALVRELQRETGRLFTAIWNDDDDMEGATFDNGLLGCGGASAEETPASRKRAGDANNVDALMVLGDCITLLAQLQPHTQPQFLQMCEKMIAALSVSGSAPAITSQQYRVIEDVMALLSTPVRTDPTSEPEAQFSKGIFDPVDIFLPRKHFGENGEAGHAVNPQDDDYREPITVTGSADPVSVQISHHHPLSGKEEVVALDISCCNVTTWALSDLEIHLRPLGGVGVVQCIDASKDLKLRLLRAGETVSVDTSGGSTSLPPFGVIKAQKQFRVCKFTQASFLVQAVLVQEPSQDVDDMGGNPAEEASPTPIRLAFSNRYMLHFDTLLRLPQPQFATAAFFQHYWQSANSGVSWHVKAQESHGGKLGVCQRALHVMNTKIGAVSELFLELPMHFHIAMLTQTRWGSYVAATLTMSLQTDSSWSGVLEVRSTRENIREFEKWPTDTGRLFCGSHVQLCNPAATPSVGSESIHAPTSASDAPTSLPAASSLFDNTASTPVRAPMESIARENGASADEPPAISAASMFAPDVRSTTSFHKDVSVATDRMSSFARSSQQPEQTRAPEATPPPDEQWGNFL